MVFTRKRKRQNKKQKTTVDEWLSEQFYFGQFSVSWCRRGWFRRISEFWFWWQPWKCNTWGEQCQLCTVHQVIQKRCANRVRKKVDSVHAAFENWVHDATWQQKTMWLYEELKWLWDQSSDRQDVDHTVCFEILTEKFSEGIRKIFPW